MFDRYAIIEEPDVDCDFDLYVSRIAGDNPICIASGRFAMVDLADEHEAHIAHGCALHILSILKITNSAGDKEDA